jgi:hypothetical protein
MPPHLLSVKELSVCVCSIETACTDGTAKCFLEHAYPQGSISKNHMKPRERLLSQPLNNDYYDIAELLVSYGAKFEKGVLTKNDIEKVRGNIEDVN